MMTAEKNRQQSQHRECEGNLEGDPSKRKCTHLPLLLEILRQRDGFHWVQLCRCSSAGVQQQPKQYVAVVGYYLRCREEYVHSMQQRKVIFLYFYFFSCFDRRVRLSDEHGYPSRQKVSRRFLGDLFYAFPQMWWAAHP